MHPRQPQTPQVDKAGLELLLILCLHLLGSPILLGLQTSVYHHDWLIRVWISLEKENDKHIHIYVSAHMSTWLQCKSMRHHCRG